MHEPLPVFDCMYCVKDSARVFKTISENLLMKKISHEVFRHYLTDLQPQKSDNEFIQSALEYLNAPYIEFQEDHDYTLSTLTYISATFRLHHNPERTKPNLRDRDKSVLIKNIRSRAKLDRVEQSPIKENTISYQSDEYSAIKPAVIDRGQAEEIGGILKEFMFDQDNSSNDDREFGMGLTEKVNINHWARNRR